MTGFVRLLKQHLLTLRGTNMTLTTPYGRYDLTHGKEFRLGGQPVDAWYPRFASQWVNAGRNPTEFTVRSDYHELHLDWPAQTRDEVSL